MSFQSPQWGDSSKENRTYRLALDYTFQSPQWGDSSKGRHNIPSKGIRKPSFSPRNGEIVLKLAVVALVMPMVGFSPRNGEIVLKYDARYHYGHSQQFQSPQWGDSSKVSGCIDGLDELTGFSPRNGEIVLKVFP